MSPHGFKPIQAVLKGWRKDCISDNTQYLLQNFLNSRDFWGRDHFFIKAFNPAKDEYLLLIPQVEVLKVETHLRSIGIKIIYRQAEPTPYHGFSELDPFATKTEYDDFLTNMKKLNQALTSARKLKPWRLQLALAKNLVRNRVIQSEVEVEESTIGNNHMNDMNKGHGSQEPLEKIKQEESNTHQDLQEIQTAINSDDSHHGNDIKPEDNGGDVKEKKDNLGSKGVGSIFVSVDVESWEIDHAKLLEVGWSVFDSGTQITTDHHFAVQEHRSLHNGIWVSDRRDCFLFGETEWKPRLECVAALQKELDDARERVGATGGKLCLVAHDLRQDMICLVQMGIRIPEGTLKFDTLAMNGARLGDYYAKSSLGKMLDEFGIENYSLHNAGNDAHYTLELFLRLARDESDPAVPPYPLGGQSPPPSP